MTTAPPAAPLDGYVCRRIGILRPPFPHGQPRRLFAADGFAVEVICLAPHSAPAGPETLVPGLRITRLHIRSRRLFHALFGKATAHRVVAAVQYVTSYVEIRDEGSRSRTALPRGRVRGQRPAAPVARRGFREAARQAGCVSRS